MAATESRLGALEDYTVKQNGHLERIEDGQVTLGDKLNAFQAATRNWQVGLLVGLVVALILLVMDLVRERASVNDEVTQALRSALPEIVQQLRETQSPP